MRGRVLLWLGALLAVVFVGWLLVDLAPFPSSGDGGSETNDGDADAALRELRWLEEASDEARQPTLPTLRGRAPRPLEEAPDAASILRRRITLHGRVLRPSFHPAAGVNVEAYGAEGRRAVGTTDAEGRYRLRWRSILRGTTVLLVARGQGLLVGSTKAWIWGSVVGRWPVDPIVLAEPGALRVHVLDGIRPVADATVRVLAALRGQHNNDVALLAKARTGAQGRADVRPLPVGRYHVEVLASDGRRGALVHDVKTATDAVVTVPLHPNRSLQVRVVDEASNEPLPDVWLGVNATWKTVHDHHRIPTAGDGLHTGPDGHAFVRGLGGRTWLRIEARKLGYAYATIDVDLSKGEAEATLRLRKLGTRRWPVVAGLQPVPPHGAVITLWPLDAAARYREGARSGTMERETLVVEGVPASGSHFLAQYGGHAVALVNGHSPNGASAAITFTRPRRVTVTVKNAEGDPVRGLLITLRALGVYPYSFATNAQGRAVFAGLPAAAFEITSVDDQLPALAADTTEGDATVEVALGHARTVHLAVTVDGARAIPPGFRLEHDQLLVERTIDSQRGLVVLRTNARPHRKTDPETVTDLRASAPGLRAGAVVVESVSAGQVRARVAFVSR